MLMRKNVNNDVSKDSPLISTAQFRVALSLLTKTRPGAKNYSNENEFHLRGMKTHFLKKGLVLGYALK